MTKLTTAHVNSLRIVNDITSQIERTSASAVDNTLELWLKDGTIRKGKNTDGTLAVFYGGKDKVPSTVEAQCRTDARKLMARNSIRQQRNENRLKGTNASVDHNSRCKAVFETFTRLCAKLAPEGYTQEDVMHEVASEAAFYEVMSYDSAVAAIKRHSKDSFVEGSEADALIHQQNEQVA